MYPALEGNQNSVSLPVFQRVCHSVSSFPELMSFCRHPLAIQVFIDANQMLWIANALKYITPSYGFLHLFCV